MSPGKKSRWDRQAERANARDAAAAPLLAYAGLLPQHTGAEMKDRQERLLELQRRQLEACRARLAQHAQDYRARLRSLVGEEEVARLQTARETSWAPKTVEYVADYWYQQFLRATRAAVLARVGKEAFAQVERECQAGVPHRKGETWLDRWWAKLVELRGRGQGSCP